MTTQRVLVSEKSTKSTIENAILAFLNDTMSIDVCSSDHDLVEAGILDSLMLVDLILYIERAFNVSPSLEDLEIENFATVARMAKFVAAAQLGHRYRNGDDR